MLVELLVGMVLMSVIGVVVLDGIVGGFKAQRGLQQRGDALNQVRTAAQRTLRQIRESTRIDSASNSALIIVRDDGGASYCMKWELKTAGSTTYLEQSTSSDCVTFTGAQKVIDGLDPSVSPFSYLPKDQWAAPSGSNVSATTCRIGSGSPATYSRHCIGAVTLSLSRVTTGHTPVSVDAQTDLRNPS